MRRTGVALLLALAFASLGVRGGCSGSCPEIATLPREPLRTGTYLQWTSYIEEAHTLNGSSGWRLVADRENRRATIELRTATGELARIRLRETAAAFDSDTSASP